MSKGAVADPPKKKKAELMHLAVARLYESPHNPRVILDDEAQAELNADVARRGILTALVVRPVKDRYEVLAGARRLRAAKAAKLATVPAQVLCVGDAEAYEIMVIENLQRKDIHPLDEAQSFKIILDRSGGDVAALSQRVNKKPIYIVKALTLNNLITHFRDWFRKGTVTKDAAFAVARLQQTDQERYLKDLEPGDRKAHSISLSDVQDWTQRNILRELDRVPWDVKDALLHPKAGACVGCPKRTGVAKDMFSDVTSGDSCTDGACFSTKLDNHLKNTMAKMGMGNVHYKLISLDQYEASGEGAQRVLGTRDYLEAGDKTCEATTKGLIAKGRRVGHVVAICMNTKCKTHRLSLGNHGSRVSASEAEKIKDERKARVLEGRVRDRILTAIVNKVTMGLTQQDMELIARSFFNRLWHEHKKRLCKRHGIIKPPSKVRVEAPPDYDDLFKKETTALEGPKFAKILMEMSLLDDVDPGPLNRDGKDLLTVAARYKVNLKEIKDLVAEEDRQASLPKKKAKK